MNEDKNKVYQNISELREKFVAINAFIKGRKISTQ